MMPYKDPEKKREYNKRWRARNKDKIKAYNYNKRYGIDDKQKDAMFKSQGRKCASCGTKSATNKKYWHLDHQHSSGKIRGILCQRCNHALGLLDDDITKILALANYVHLNG